MGRRKPNPKNDVSPPERELLTADDVAHVLSTGRSSVFSLVREGRIPAPLHLTRGLTRWRRRELIDWLEAGAPPASAWRWAETVKFLQCELITALRARVEELRSQIESLEAEAAQRRKERL